MRFRGFSFGLVCGLAVVAAPSLAEAQIRTEAIVMLSGDTVGQADVFELTVGVGVPPGSAVYFPDTVPTVLGLESHHPATWTAEPSGEGASLTLTYPLIAFQEGVALLPGLDVFIGPGAGVEGERLPGGSVIGAWAAIESGSVPRSTLTRVAVARQTVWVASVIGMEDVTDGLEPRPAADVFGASWNWPSVVMMMVFVGILVGVATSVTRGILAERRANAPPETPDVDPAFARWQSALDELDRILGLGLHTAGRTAEFYEQSSGVVRTYVEAFESEWSPALTSSELMRRLETHTNGSAPDLYSSMQAAEIVKFGRLRPDSGAAEGHWTALRDWVQGSWKSGP